MLALLKQPPILKKKEELAPQPKIKGQETWLLQAAALVGVAVGSQLALLAELYEHRLGGSISGLFKALQGSYKAYCEEAELRQENPERGILNSFTCESWFGCQKVPLSKVQETKDRLIKLFLGAGESPESTNRVSRANDWYECIHMSEKLKESGYAKPIYVLLGGNLPLLKETVQHFQPGVLNWTSTLIYSVAGGIFAFGSTYMTIHTARWLHGALLIQPPNQRD